MTRRTREWLVRHVAYDPESGFFTRRNCFFKSRDGAVVGTKPTTTGYVYVSVDGRSYPAHRLAWLHMTGQWPKGQIDHIDMNGGNNRWSNLRLATRSQNRANTRKRTDSSSPFKGVSWRPRQKKWMATCGVGGKRHYLGYHATAEEAQAAYMAAAIRLHGEFARAG
jgi:hypothetical protein